MWELPFRDNAILERVWRKTRKAVARCANAALNFRLSRKFERNTDNDRGKKASRFNDSTMMKDPLLFSLFTKLQRKFRIQCFNKLKKIGWEFLLLRVENRSDDAGWKRSYGIVYAAVISISIRKRSRDRGKDR